MIFISSHSTAIRRIELGVGILTTAVLIGLHITVLLQAGALWRDEVNTINLATVPSLSTLWSMNEYDSFPMFWFLVVRFWSEIGLGGSDFALRGLGLIVGAGVVGMLWWTARSFRCDIPLLSLLLFCLNPTTLRIGDSLRAYGCGILVMLFMLGAIWKMLQDPTPARITFATLASILSVQCLYSNSVLLFAVCTGGIAVSVYNRNYKSIGILTGISFVAFLSLLPYIGTIERLQTWNILVKVPLEILWIIGKFCEAVDQTGRGTCWIWVVLLGASLEICHFKFFKSNRNGKEQGLFFGVAIIASILCYILFLKALSYPTNPWHYIPIMAFLAVLFDAVVSLAVSDKAGWKIARLGFFLVFATAIIPNSWQAAHTRQTNVDLIASKLEVVAAKEDLILVFPWWPGVTFKRYYTGDTLWTTLPDIEDHQIHRFDLVKQKMMQAEPIRPLLEKIRETLRAGHKVWLAGGLPFLEPGEVPEYLPPAPHGPKKWQEDPYLLSWARQASYEMQRCGSNISEVSLLLSSPVNPMEKLPLFVVDGCRPYVNKE